MKKIIGMILAGLLIFSTVGAAAVPDELYRTALQSAFERMDRLSGVAKPKMEKISTSIISNVETEISFQIGDDTLRINGRDVTVVAPFEEDGTTLVPLRVITEAYGAKVDWEESDQKITLICEGIEITIWIDRTDAVINGDQNTMLKAPVLANGDTTMVPLRFISENFGAMVSYDDATARVTVRKMAVCPLSPVNYGMVSNSGKEYMGDSYHAWYTKMPEGFRVTYRSFDGSTYYLTNDASASLRFETRRLGEDTMETVYKQVQESYQDYTILDKADVMYNGRNFNALTVVGDNMYTKVYMTLLDDVCYILTVNAFTQEYFTENRTVFEGILNDLRLGGFNEGIAADYSNVDGQGFREYRNKAAGISFKIPADWKLEDENNLAEIHFSCQKGDNMVAMHAVVDKNTNKLTPAQLQSTIKPAFVGAFNEKYVTVNDSGSFGQGEAKGAKLDFDAEARNLYFGTKAILAVSGDYFFNLQMATNGAKKEDFDQRQLTQIWNSIQIGSVDPSKLIIIDDGKGETQQPLKKVELAKSKITLELMDGWEQVELEKRISGSGGMPDIYQSVFTFEKTIPLVCNVITYDLKLSAAQAHQQINALQKGIENNSDQKIKDFESLAEQKIGENTFWISQFVIEDERFDIAVIEFMTYSDTGIHIFGFQLPDIFYGEMCRYYVSGMVNGASF